MPLLDPHYQHSGEGRRTYFYLFSDQSASFFEMKLLKEKLAYLRSKQSLSRLQSTHRRKKVPSLIGFKH